MFTFEEQTPAPTATAQPQTVSLRNATTVDQVKQAVMRLQFDEVSPVQDSIVPANLIWGNAEPLPVNTKNGMKSKYVVSSQTVVNFPQFATAINAFSTQPFATAEDARNAFYSIADKYTVRVSVWEDNADLNLLKSYGKAQGILKLSDPYTTKSGEVKQSWELTRVTSNAVVATTTRRSFGTAIATPSGTPQPQATPQPQGVPQPVMAGPTPPQMKRLSDGSVYSVEALKGTGWSDAQISALADA
jgi:hypothetical protein